MNINILNKFDRILPKYIDDSSSRKTKFYALVNTLSPQVYTVMMSFMCMFGSNDSIKSTNTLMVILYIMVMGGVYAGIQWARENKPDFYDWANSPQDVYNSLLDPENHELNPNPHNFYGSVDLESERSKVDEPFVASL